MEDERFDALARSIVAGSSRRGTLRLLAGAALSGLLARLDRPGVEDAAAHNALRKCKKIDDPQRRKRCVKAAKRHNRRHTTPSGSCPVAPDGSLTHAAEARFDGKLLRVEQTAQAFGPRGENAGRMALTLGGGPLLTQEVEAAEGILTATITYGGAVRGVRRIRVRNDGTTITGEVDGRALVPLPADADPGQARFADGRPPPEVRVDPELARAVTALLRRSKQEARDCRATPPEPARVAAEGRRGDRVEAAGNPRESFACLAAQALCQKGYVACMFGMPAACGWSAAGGPAAFAACIAVALGICYHGNSTCLRLARANSLTCCPVTCGEGNSPLIPYPFGVDPGCCDQDEVCLRPDVDAPACCPPGSRACHGRSCCQGFESCREDGECCPAGTSPCGPSNCCRDGETCMKDGTCCPDSIVCGGASGRCCRGGTNCCPPSNVCCPVGQSCVNGECKEVCNPELDRHPCPSEPGYPRCCTGNAVCCRNGECCGSFAPVCCPGSAEGCCLRGQRCCTIQGGAFCASTCER